MEKNIYNFLSSKFVKVNNDNNKSVEEFKNINELQFNPEEYITNIKLEYEIMKDKYGRENQINYSFQEFDYAKYKNEINKIIYNIIQNVLENKNNNIKSIRLIMKGNENDIRIISNIQNYIYGGESKFNSEMKKAIFKMLSVYDADGLILYPTNLEIFNIEFNKSGGCNSTDQNKIVFE